ncbi:hypothetical protein AFLA_010226 [Aspergillus flavus NRRL3357]|nr:hypothetical protein AFLA_010226 [Aspergillus flavus NRRL3357]
MSPFSQVPGRKERRDSVSSLASVSSTMEDDSLVHRPSMSYVNVPDSSLHGLSGRVRTHGNDLEHFDRLSVQLTIHLMSRRDLTTATRF